MCLGKSAGILSIGNSTRVYLDVLASSGINAVGRRINGMPRTTAGRPWPWRHADGRIQRSHHPLTALSSLKWCMP